jgi:CubicO group peptidase (beta-lactamase class C family)
MLVILLLKSVLIFTVDAQTYSAERLNHKVDSLMALLTSDANPGGAIAIVSGDKTLLAKGYGLMNTELKLPVNNHTIFDIASVSKQFTAYAILLLEEEGKVVLDNDIRTYLPYLPAYEHKITVRNLLQHTSGIASTDVLRLFAGMSLDENWDQQKEIELIKQYPQLNFNPNTRHVYSNGGYALLAQIVNEVSGMSFSRYMERRIFKPLGMKSALVYSDPSIKLKNSSLGYKMVDGKPVMVSSTTDFSYGSGNIHINLNDMIRWGQNFLSPKVGNKELINRIFTPYNTLENGDSLFYTYGFYTGKYKGVKMVDHSGGVPGYRNQFMIFPDNDLVIILMFNNESINTRRLANSIADILLEGKTVQETPKPRVETKINLEKARQFAGNYQMEEGMELGFSVERDTFWLLVPGNARFQLFGEEGNSFFLKAFDARCTFVNAPGGDGYELIWFQGGGSSTGKKVGEKIVLNTEEIACYAGKYYQNDLKVEYPLLFADGKLTMYTPPTFKKYVGFDSVELTHINGDRFLTDKLGVMEFTRDESNTINGFILLDVGRLQNIKFLLVNR